LVYLLLLNIFGLKLHTLLPTDIELINGLHNSNEQAFESLFRMYYDRLCNYANTIVKDTDEAEEMVQQTFLIVWENRENLAIHTSVKSYLYRAVHNSCLNKLKHNKVRQKHDEHYKLQTENVFENGAQELLGNELEKQINDAINTLPPQCKTVFVLSRFENLTYAEIAEQLGISIKTVDKHMVKALKIMRSHLKDYLPILILLLFCKN
jgi:RNA polymerase sigma-70 factor (family 1)